jgi:hypothetical protein
MKFIKKVVNFFRNLFGSLDRRVEVVKTQTFPAIPTQDRRLEPVAKKSMSKTIEEYNENLKISLPDGSLLLRYSQIKQQVESGVEDEELLLEYTNELEYRGLKYD